MPKDNHCHVCPWWLAYAFDNPLRRLVHKPARIFTGLVNEGDTILDVGCGMGYFSLGLAELVGPEGKVYAVDLQPQMLKRVTKRATRRQLQDRIIIHQCESDKLGLNQEFDFILAFWMIHEVPDQKALGNEIFGLLKPGGHILFAEPSRHVTEEAYTTSLNIFISTGLTAVRKIDVRFSRAMLLEKTKPD